MSAPLASDAPITINMLFDTTAHSKYIKHRINHPPTVSLGLVPTAWSHLCSTPRYLRPQTVVECQHDLYSVD